MEESENSESELVKPKTRKRVKKSKNNFVNTDSESEVESSSSSEKFKPKRTPSSAKLERSEELKKLSLLRNKPKSCQKIDFDSYDSENQSSENETSESGNSSAENSSNQSENSDFSKNEVNSETSEESEYEEDGFVASDDSENDKLDYINELEDLKQNLSRSSEKDQQRKDDYYKVQLIMCPLLNVEYFEQIFS